LGVPGRLALILILNRKKTMIQIRKDTVHIDLYFCTINAEIIPKNFTLIPMFDFFYHKNRKEWYITIFRINMVVNFHYTRSESAMLRHFKKKKNE
jgi:hypothetical protein